MKEATNDGRAEAAQELSAEELESQEAAELPDREAMSLVNANVAAPVNAAVAANVLSDGSIGLCQRAADRADHPGERLDREPSTCSACGRHRAAGKAVK